MDSNKIFLHQGDIPAGAISEDSAQIAVDTETMGLNLIKDRLCLVQLCSDGKNCHLVQIPQSEAGNIHQAPNLKALLENKNILKIFHYARFDLTALKLWLGIEVAPVYCTKIASKLARSYTDRHGLKELCREIIGVDISKAQQSSDWGSKELNEKQKQYAAQDVLYLADIKARLDIMLKRENRYELAISAHNFISEIIKMDLELMPPEIIFSH